MKEASRTRRLFWIGHLSPEEDPIGQVQFVPGLMRALGKMDIPGTDLTGAAIGGAYRTKAGKLCRIRCGPSADRLQSLCRIFRPSTAL